MALYTLQVPKEWHGFAAMVATALPNYLVSQLGPRFGEIFYKHLAGHSITFSLAAYDQEGELAGCILATLDRRATRKLTFPVIVKLLLAANIRLLSPAFFRWLVRGIFDLAQKKTILQQSPAAELIIFVVAPAFRGDGLAHRLFGEMETFFQENGVRESYLILTEKENRMANRFYAKKNCHLAGSYRHHSREMNAWHKSLA